MNHRYVFILALFGALVGTVLIFGFQGIVWVVGSVYNGHILPLTIEHVKGITATFIILFTISYFAALCLKIDSDNLQSEKD